MATKKRCKAVPADIVPAAHLLYAYLLSVSVHSLFLLNPINTGTFLNDLTFTIALLSAHVDFIDVISLMFGQIYILFLLLVF